MVNRVIEFMGPDGAGKTTLATAIADEVINGVEGIYVHSPPEHLKFFFTSEYDLDPDTFNPNDLDPHQRMLYFLLGNEFTSENIGDIWLDRGNVFIDRYIYDTLASHSALMNQPFESVMRYTAFVREPDVAFHVTASPEVLAERLEGRVATHVYEKIPVLMKMDKEYGRLANERSNIHTIDTSHNDIGRSLDEIRGYLDLH